ncbi:MAG: ParB/RepB/Spo0J family partition protein [Gammaproteobacteria bacterium]|nr:ParB/RepB/Spo0J family partition protein [Gammaproteobacteria bacterium]
MDHSNRKIHHSGPLSMLLEKGEIKKIDEQEPVKVVSKGTISEQKQREHMTHFKTQSGIEFKENELFYIDPKVCEPWQYANRQENELGDMEALKQSIQNHQQLQPALVRPHPSPHDSIQYEIIFGRRRHIACLQLDIPFLVIRKNMPNVEEAILAQDAENKFRQNVSDYSNAKLYEKLLKDKVFPSQKALAKTLNLSPTSFTELMAFTKLPNELVEQLPNVHTLSKSFVTRMVSISAISQAHHDRLLEVAPRIGKTITSPTKLERLIQTSFDRKNMGHMKQVIDTKRYKTKEGVRLFTFRYNHQGAPMITFNRDDLGNVDFEKLCLLLQETLENQLLKFGAPDSKE